MLLTTLESRSALFNSLGKYDIALSDLDKTIILEPDNSWALCYRVKILYTLGKYEEALVDAFVLCDS